MPTNIVRTTSPAAPAFLVVYFGVPNTEGCWRLRQVGNNLAVERYESGVWNEKTSFTP